jgi:hypothetical protein
MVHAGVRPLVFSTLLALSAGTPPALAQQPRPEPAVERPSERPTQVVLAQDANETREEFEGLLKRMPPAVGRVLRLDPSLLRNQAYLAPYPALGNFLQQHPEIVNNPGYYLENVRIELWYPPSPRDRQDDAVTLWRNAIEGFTILIVFIVVSSGVLWIIKTVLDWRRWTRTSRVHAEVHNKLLDRFTANDDLLAYIQTPAGQKFLESAPLPVEPASRPMFAPYSRILWSTQAGLVFAAAGIGLLYVAGQVIEEVSQLLFAVGVLALAVGVGFVVSAVASLLLSQRLGLMTSSATREHSESRS